MNVAFSPSGSWTSYQCKATVQSEFPLVKSSKTKFQGGGGGGGSLEMNRPLECYIIAAILEDDNKRFLIRFYC